MLEHLSSFIIHLIQSSGYFGIFLLMTLESALIPIPSEVTMPFAGFLVSQGALNFPLVVILGALGNLIGSWIAYGIGYFLEETFIVSFVKKYGKFLLISHHEYELSTKWLQRYGVRVSFFSRILPAVRTFISLPAGIAEINFFKFSLFTFLGSLIWSAFLTYIGVYLGEKWNTLEPYYRKFEFLIVGIFLIGVLWYINHKLKIIKFKKTS